MKVIMHIEDNPFVLYSMAKVAHSALNSEHLTKKGDMCGWAIGDEYYIAYRNKDSIVIRSST